MKYNISIQYKLLSFTCVNILSDLTLLSAV